MAPLAVYPDQALVPAKIFLPLPTPKDAVPPCTAVRSTLLASSVLALKHQGWFERYQSALPAVHREAILYNVAGHWLPIELGLAHYTACDALDLDAAGMLAIGSRLTALAQKSMFSFVLRLATQSGMTPWNLLSNAQTHWARSYQGSALEILELGPKEAKMTVFGQPLATIRYWRGSLCGIISTLVTAFSQRAVVRDLPWSGRTPHEVSYRISWV